ncbi:MAG: hypothetical protein OXF02_04205 [Simkaniaceae bacterium]|nr:hypothetical protein [Simkaniaceae bacterium]
MSIHKDEVDRTGEVSRVAQHAERRSSPPPDPVVAYYSRLHRSVGVAGRIIEDDPSTGYLLQQTGALLQDMMMFWDEYMGTKPDGFHNMLTHCKKDMKILLSRDGNNPVARRFDQEVLDALNGIRYGSDHKCMDAIKKAEEALNRRIFSGRC